MLQQTVYALYAHMTCSIQYNELAVLTIASVHGLFLFAKKLDPVSISDKTSHFIISQCLEAARFVFRIVRLPWNLTGTSAVAMRWFKLPISRLRDFTRSYDKTSYRILKGVPVSVRIFQGSCSFRRQGIFMQYRDLWKSYVYMQWQQSCTIKHLRNYAKAWCMKTMDA